MTISKKTQLLNNTIETEFLVKPLKGNKTMALLTNSLNNNNNNSNNNNNHNNILANGWSNENANNNNSINISTPDNMWTSTKLPLAAAIKNRHKYDKLLPNTANSTRLNETNEAHNNDVVPAQNERIDINSTSDNVTDYDGGGWNAMAWQAQQNTKLTPLATSSTTATLSAATATTTTARDDLKNVKFSRHMKHKQPYESNKLNGYTTAPATTTAIFANSNISPSSSSGCSIDQASGAVAAVTPHSCHDSAQKLIKLPHNKKASRVSKTNCCNNHISSNNSNLSSNSSDNKNMHINKSKYFDNALNGGSRNAGNGIPTNAAILSATPTTLNSCHTVPTNSLLATTTASSSASGPASNFSPKTQTLQKNSITVGGGLLKHQQPQQQQQQQQNPPLATSSVQRPLPAATSATSLSSNGNSRSNYEVVKNVNNLNNTNATNLYSNSNYQHQQPAVSLTTNSNSSSNSSLYSHNNHQYMRQSLLPTSASATSTMSSSSSLPPPPPSSASAPNCNCCSYLIARCCFGLPHLKAINVRRCVLALFAITVVTIFYYTHYMDTGVFVG